MGGSSHTPLVGSTPSRRGAEKTFYAEDEPNSVKRYCYKLIKYVNRALILKSPRIFFFCFFFSSVACV